MSTTFFDPRWSSRRLGNTIQRDVREKEGGGGGGRKRERGRGERRGRGEEGGEHDDQALAAQTLCSVSVCLFVLYFVVVVRLFVFVIISF